MRFPRPGHALRPPRPPRILRRGPGAVWVLSAVLITLAGVLAVALRDQDAAVHGASIPFWGLVLGFAAAELCVVHVHVRRSAHSITLGELPLVLGLVFAGPVEVSAAWALGSGLVLAGQRLAPVRLTFNVAQFAVTALLSAGVLHLLVDSGADGGPRVWAAAAAAVVVGSALSSPLIVVAMALSGERVTLRGALGLLPPAVVVSAVNVSFGLAVATVLEADPVSVVLLLAPAGTLWVAYRAYLGERRKHMQLEFLYRAARTLASASNPEAGLAGMLATANEAFRTERSEVCAFGAGDGGRSVVVGPEDRVTFGDELPDDLVAELHALLDRDLRPRLVDPAQAGPALAAHLERAGVQRAMLAGLPGDDGLVGAVLVANRHDGGAFKPVDLQLLGTLAGHVGSVVGQDRLGRRVVELREVQRTLEHQAFHDALTGLANRLLFMDRVRHALARRDGTAAVLYIDLDDFKPVNDTLGHEAGDLLLRAVADRLRCTLRPADTPARLGGDEFAVLLVDIDPEAVPIVAERIMRTFATPVQLGGGASRPIFCSMGVASAPAGSMDADELVRNADAAMYASKHGGKRGVRVYDPAA